jgi:hypothetical protein
MDQLCELGTPIAFFVSGKALPIGFYDPSLPAGEQAMHLGTYRVMQCAQEDPLDKEAMNQMVAFCKEYYALDPCMLRFHLEHRKKYQAHPALCESRPYSHLRVNKRDDRKPLFEVAHGDSYQTLLSPQSPNFISEKTMVSEWIADGHHLELLDSPYQAPGTPSLGAANGISIVQPLQSAAATCRPLKKRMTHLARRKITFDCHWEILLKASIASFARLLEINVDADGKIGPLIDIVPSIHTAGFELTNYSHCFRIGSRFQFLDLVGPEFQKSPTTHPIRTYDPKVLWLMSCDGGGRFRAERNGLAWLQERMERTTDLFFQCILVEVVKIQALVEWSRCFHPDGPRRLPTASEIPIFLEHIDGILQLTGVDSTCGIIQEQYDVSKNYDDRLNFRRFLGHLGVELQPWLSRLFTALAIGPSLFKNGDIFSGVVQRLSTFISHDAALGSSFSVPAHPYEPQ